MRALRKRRYTLCINFVLALGKLCISLSKLCVDQKVPGDPGQPKANKLIIIRVHFSDSDIGQRFYYFELFVVGIVGMLKGSSSFFVIWAFITINLLDTAPRISVEFLNYLVF